MPDSSTGGFLVPSATGGALDDQALDRFLQGLVAGITGTPGNLVRPRWQEEPTNVPPFGTSWIAIGESRRTKDTFAAVFHQSPSVGPDNDLVIRNEILEVQCTFYGPNARGNAELLFMGFDVAQNRELLQQSGYGFVECGQPTVGADQVHAKWVRTVEVPFRLRRVQEFKYPVLSILGAQVTVTDDAVTAQVSVQAANAPAPLPLFGFGIVSNTISGFGLGSWK